MNVKQIKSPLYYAARCFQNALSELPVIMLTTELKMANKV